MVCSRMRATTLRDDADVDVGLEQRGADLLQDLVDVGLGEAALAADLLDDAFEAVRTASRTCADQATGRPRARFAMTDGDDATTPTDDADRRDER